MSPRLHETKMGRRLIESDVPEIARTGHRIADAIESLTSVAKRSQETLDAIDMRLLDMVDLLKRLESKGDD